MVGNVWEWVEDWYDPDYYATSPNTDPGGPSSGSERVLRGGSWNDFPVYLRASYRVRDLPVGGYVDIGVRCTREVVSP